MNCLHKHWLIPGMVILLVLSMAACGPQDEPSRVAEKFLRAAVVNDLADLQETVDPDYQDQVLMSILLQMGLSAFVGGAQGEYTELKVTTIANDGQRATVHATGKLKVVALGTQMSVPVDVQIPLVKKQGRWYVTSSEARTLPTTVPTDRMSDAEAATATATWLSAFYVDNTSTVEHVYTQGYAQRDGLGTYGSDERGAFRFTATLHNQDTQAHCIVFGFKVRVQWDSGKVKTYPSLFADEYQLVAVNLEAQEQRKVPIVIDDEVDYWHIGGSARGEVSEWQVMMVDGEVYHSYFDPGMLNRHRDTCKEYHPPQVIRTD